MSERGVQPPTGEANIVWLEPSDEFDYVRASTMLTPDRTGEIEFRPHGDYYTTVGYSELDEDTDAAQMNDSTPMYRRRVFWLKTPDRPLDGDPTWDEKAPAEAVDPRTIDVGARGWITERAAGETEA